MTIILAKFLGLYFLGTGISFLVNPKRICNVYQMMMKNEATLFLGGLMALLFGALIISVHNVWVMGWPIIITIIGWWGFIKGLGLLSFAQFFSFFLQKSNFFYLSIGILITLVGLFLAYQGWQ